MSSWTNQSQQPVTSNYGSYPTIYPPTYNDQAYVEYGGISHLEDPDAKDFTSSDIRQGFIRKVFLLLSIMLLTVALVTAFFLNNDTIYYFVRHNTWISLLACGVAIVAMLALFCCEGLARQHPTNLIVLSIFTLAQSFMVACVCCLYNTTTVLHALAITCLVTVAIAGFAMQTKIDFTFLTGTLIVVGFVMMGMSVFIVFLHSRMVDIMFSGLGAFLFGLWLLVDVQLIVGGEHREEISPEDYVFATLILFMDIINLFLYVLRLVEILGGNNN
eukprot:CFRG1152T1